MSLDLLIDSVGHQGDGLATGSDGRVFVPGALPGERVRVDRVVDGRADGLTVLEPSADRVPVASTAHAETGVAPLQHWATGPYLDWKRSLVVEALEREGLDAEVAAIIPVSPASRRRLALHARRDEDGQVVLGFKARRSWRVVPIETCPVSDPRLVAALPALRKVAEAFLVGGRSAPTLHVTLTDTGLDLDVTGVEKRGWSRDRAQHAVRLAMQADLARLSLDGEVLAMQRQPTVRFGRATVPLPPGGFLQAAPEAEAAMAGLAVEAIEGVRKVADLFCGAGTFTFPLAEVASVIAADGSASAIAALKAGAATASGLKPIEAQARDLFRRPLSPFDLKGVEAIVFDPPRAGAQAQVEQMSGTKAEVIVGVSCNPQTFVRDARVLVDAGWRLERVTPVDQFLWSSHIELIGLFRR